MLAVEVLPFIENFDHSLNMVQCISVCRFEMFQILDGIGEALLLYNGE
jgi:hypothetical protein